MHINNPDALRNWLTIILEPLCDADPAALARYVIALLKKDKPMKELKNCMQEQLDVFLSHETTPFLERLFEAIKSEEYLINAQPVESVQESSTGVEDVASVNSGTKVKIEKECTPPLSDNKAKEHDSISLSPLSSIQSTSGGASSIAHTPLKTRESPVPRTIKEEGHTREVRRRPRSRSRSRSFDRLKRSRSKERRINDHIRERNVHKYRNKSPPGNMGRRFDRRGGFSNRRNRSQSGSRSRSISPERKKPSRSISPSLTSEKDSHPKKRQRCRDFDEKGYCMRGETCPWDHGVDPVVLEDINNPALLSIQGSGPIRAGPVHPEYNPYAPDLWNRGNIRPGAPGLNPTGFSRLPPGPQFKGVQPNAPFPFQLNPAVAPLQQRELIPVPVCDGGNQVGDTSVQMHVKRRYDNEENVAIPEGPTKRSKPPIQNRLGPRLPAQQNCSLELRKIPRGLNAISHLNNHFSKFGKIVNIQISYDGDPEAAIVTFSTHAEANVAYRSTEAVLNNRFIKVFWHTPTGNANGDQQNSNSKPDNPMAFRKINNPGQYHLNHKVNEAAIPVSNASTTVANSGDPITSSGNVTVDEKSGTITTTTPTGTQSISNKGMTLVNTAAGAVPAPAPIRVANPKLKREVAQLQRKQKENAVQVAVGLLKKKQGLLDEYVKQMQSTVMLLERTDLTDTQRSTYKTTIKELDAKIVALKKEIAAEQQNLTATQPAIQVRKTKEQRAKELLDVELDLITQEHQDGNNRLAIEKKLKELQKSIHAAKARVRPVIPRIAPPGSTSVDRRPTTIHVIGFELDDSDIILGHFKHFGEITKNELDKSVPSLTISYATRLNAEQAMQRGRIFKEKPLQITWVTTNIAATKPATLESLDSAGSQESTTTITTLKTPGVDDDEEEQEEERSWRR